MQDASILFRGFSAFPITPADPHGHVDTDALLRLVDRLTAARVDSVGLLGSTGTYAYLTRAERRRAIEAAAEALRGQTGLIVGIGALRTDDAQDLARDAKAAGADGLLLAPVSYTPLTEAEVFAHFRAVAETTDLPLCIYNNPGTTHFTFSDALLARLASIGNIVAVKNPAPPAREAAARQSALRALVPADFALGYSVDWHAPTSVLAGGDAWYSVIGGLLPVPALRLMRAAQAGDAATVKRWDALLQPLWVLFRELSSLRVVYAGARLLGLCHHAPPRPILPLDRADDRRIAVTLDALGTAAAPLA